MTSVPGPSSRSRHQAATCGSSGQFITNALHSTQQKHRAKERGPVANSLSHFAAVAHFIERRCVRPKQRDPPGANGVERRPHRSTPIAAGRRVRVRSDASAPAAAQVVDCVDGHSAEVRQLVRADRIAVVSDLDRRRDLRAARRRRGLSREGSGNTRQRQRVAHEGSGNAMQRQCLSHEGSGNTRQRHCLTVRFRNPDHVACSLSAAAYSIASPSVTFAMMLYEMLVSKCCTSYATSSGSMRMVVPAPMMWATSSLEKVAVSCSDKSALATT